MASKIVPLLVLCFVHLDEDDAARTARSDAILEEHPGARVVFRRGDVFTGWTETSLNNTPVGLVDPGAFENVEAAFHKARIPIFKPKPKKPAKTGDK